MKKIVMLVVLVVAMAAKADYWMTFCKTPGGQQYSQVGYVKPDADGFVTIKAGPLLVHLRPLLVHLFLRIFQTN